MTERTWMVHVSVDLTFNDDPTPVPYGTEVIVTAPDEEAARTDAISQVAGSMPEDMAPYTTRVIEMPADDWLTQTLLQGQTDHLKAVAGFKPVTDSIRDE